MKGEKIFSGLEQFSMELTLQEKLRLINFFEFLLDKEVSKPLGEMDSEAVDNYVKILLHLQDKHIELSPEFIDEQVRKIFHPEENTAPETVKTTKKQYKKTKVWLVAACIAILVALFSIVSFSSEKSVKDFLEDFFGTYEFIPFGKEIDVDNKTYIKEGTAKHYKSIDDLIKTEKLDILYPTNTEYSIELISVGDVDKKETINIVYTDSIMSIDIVLNSEISQEIIDFCNDKITLNGIEYFLCIIEDVNRAQAYFIYDNNMYVVTCTNEKELMEILNNMEEIKYED